MPILIHNHNLGSDSNNVETSSILNDYVGFTYNGKHSSELGIVRTSDGSRFNENLLPTIQDKTIQVPGGDGTYFFGSYYTQRQFNISFAFDSLTEVQFANLQKTFGDKGIHDLIFDERPYKAYKAKVTGTATVKYIVFDENGGRVYKGEGSVQFTCYSPYAVCTKRFLEEYDDNEYPNKNEWKDAAGLASTESYSSYQEEGTTKKLYYDQYAGGGNQSSGTITTYNPGVKESDWCAVLKFKEIEADGENKGKFLAKGKFSYGSDELVISSAERKGNDTHIMINTKTNLIEGLICTVGGKNNNIIQSLEKTGNIYNEYLSGSFFKIPQGEKVINLSDIWYTDLGVFQKGDGDWNHRHLTYDYYYY